MSYPATEVWKTFANYEVVLGGGATFATNAELAQVVVTLFKTGTPVGGERMRVLLYHDASMQKLYATGEWFTLANAYGAATHWRGTVPLNFTAGAWPWVEAGRPYYVAIECEYVRNGDLFYIALAYDWPNAINDNAAALAMAFIVRQGVR